MDASDHRIRVLRTLPPDERLAAIGSAFAVAPPDEREKLGLLLLELACKPFVQNGLRRGRRRFTLRVALREEAVGLLARHWTEVPIGLRQVALAAGRGAWAEAIGTLPPAELTARGTSLARLFLDSCDPTLTRHLPMILEHGDAQAAAMAGQALLAQALRLTEQADAARLGIEEEAIALQPVLDAEAAPWTSGDVRGLLRAVAEGVQSFDRHRRREVLLAALVLLESPRQGMGVGDELAELATNGVSPAGPTLRSAFRRARAPLARQRAWIWLREGAVAVACTERIARAWTPTDHEVLLALGHLALAPARSGVLGLVPIATRPAPADQTPPGVPPGRRLHPQGPVPDQSTLAMLTPVARRNVPRLIESLDADRATRELALDPFLTEPDPIARLSAARVASGGASRDFCFDPEEVIARHAALRAVWSGVAESGRLRAGDDARRRFAATLRRAPHPAVRAIGSEGFDRVTPGGRGQLQLLAARRAHTADPSFFADWVRQTLGAAAPDEAVRTLMLCRRIGAVTAVETILLRIISDSLTGTARSDSREAATAVACLGDLRAPRTEGLMRECLARHPDARVRANAAEALGRIRPPRRDALTPAEDPVEDHHRVRASVLRGLLAPGSEPKAGGAAAAVDSLSLMLTDPRPAHRLAGVWVVQRSLRAGLEGAIGRLWDRLAGRVRWLADEDTDPGVRARAGVVTGRLDAAIAGLGPRAAGGVAV